MIKTDGDTCVFGGRPRNPRRRRNRLARVSLLSWNVWLALLASCVLPSDLLGQAAIEQATDDATQINAKEPQVTDDQRQAIDQIKAIRRQMGGGVASQLEGLFEGSGQGREHLQREFDRQLKGLVGSPPKVPAAQSEPATDSNHDICSTLRQAARELDSIAADVEDVQLYAEADQIRANAKILRLRARVMAPARVASTALPSAKRAPPASVPAASATHNPLGQAVP